jgi:NCAIR mutase (PurE)-related protein
LTIRYDYSRRDRIGLPEAILCEGKAPQFLRALVGELSEHPDHPVLFTRLSAEQHEALGERAEKLDYDPLSRTASINGTLTAKPGRVAVVCAGTSDLAVAEEARRTLDFMGIATSLVADVGVAGLWRLMEQIDEIATHDVVIVVAGMDAALASVIGGLIGKPIIGVPTSVGYGVAIGGGTALNSMLASCAQGILVTNIDNGFGAACGAVRLLHHLVALT